MATITPRRNGGTNEVTQNNYISNVVDSVGVQILPPVKTYGARGTNAKWGYDKNGLIVETGWSKKIDLYRIINDTSKPISARVEAIDTRAISLTSDAQTYIAAYSAYADAQKEIDELYALIPAIFSLGLSETKESTGLFSIIPNLFAGGVKLLAKTQKPDDYKTLMQQLRKKLIHLEAELKGLEVLKSNLTGEYSKFDKVVSDADRSANLADNWALWLIGILILFFIIKRRK